MKRLCSQTMIPIECVTFEETDWDEMYESYLNALKKIRRYKKYLQDIYREQRQTKSLSREQIEFRNVINETEEGIIETLQCIEKYLVRKDFTDKHNKIKLKIEEQYIFEDLASNNLHEIISNKLYKEKLYSILEDELTLEQFNVISLYYGMNMTQNMIAEELNISQKKVSFYLKNAYGKIIVSKRINEFLAKME